MASTFTESVLASVLCVALHKRPFLEAVSSSVKWDDKFLTELVALGIKCGDVCEALT